MYVMLAFVIFDALSDFKRYIREFWEVWTDDGQGEASRVWFWVAVGVVFAIGVVREGWIDWAAETAVCEVRLASLALFELRPS